MSADIFKEAILDCCPMIKMPENIQNIYDLNKSEKTKVLVINSEYSILIGKKNNILNFSENKVKDLFPGVEYISEVKNVADKNDKEFNGELILTYHDDMKKWTGSIHLQDNSVNKMTNIVTAVAF